MDRVRAVYFQNGSGARRPESRETLIAGEFTERMRAGEHSINRREPSLLAVRLPRRQGNAANDPFSKSNAGFTLIEVMAAMLILALVCVAYSENQVGAIQLVRGAEYRNTAIMLAKQRMTEVEFTVQTKGIEEIKDQDKGDFDTEKFEGFSWKLWKNKVPPPDFSALMAASGTEGEEEDSQQQPQGLSGPMKMIMDIWGKSIFEVHLEINWKEGEQEKSYTLMTHYIASDATQQIQGLVGSMVSGFKQGK